MTSQIRVDEITNRSGLGTVTIYDNGFEFTGVTTFTEDVDITGGLTIGGVLTYEDVTNIDSVGIITARAGLHVTGGNFGIGTNNPTNKLEVEGSASVARFVGNRTDALGPRLSLAKSRGSTSGSATIVQDGDEIGQIMFKGADGTDADSTGAAIIARVNGTPGVNDMPGTLTFLTTNDGTNSPTERLRITSGGDLGLGVSGGMNQAGTLYIQGGQGVRWTHTSDGTLYGDHYVSASGHHVLRTGSGLTERLRITSDGKIGVGENSPDRLLHIKGASSTAYSGGSDTADYNFLKIENTTNDKSAGIFFQIGGNGEAAITATEVVDGNTDIAFQNRGGGVRSEKLRITSDGAIAVGNASQMGSNYARISIDCQGRNIYSGTTDVTNYGLAFHNDPTTNHANGIGFFNDDGTTIGGYIVHQDKGGSNSGDIVFGTSSTSSVNNPTERLRITSAGDTELRNTVSSITNSYSQYLKFRTTQTNGQSAVTGQIAGQGKSNWGGDLVFYSKPANGTPNDTLTERLRISSGGYVTKPNHPCFDAVRNSGHMSASVYINYNTVKVNNGGHYNSSNGRFTAPVAGYYFFSWTAIKNNTNSVTRLYIHKNGSAAYGNRHLRLDAGQDYGDNGTMTAVIQLAVNDYVQIYLGAGAIYGVTEEYCIFNGYLLG